MVPDKNRERGWLFAKNIGECTAEDMTSRISHLFDWATCEKGSGRTVRVRSITGIACPYVWNEELDPLFTEMLEQGVYYEHIFGPLMATQDGENVLLKIHKRFPQMMDFRVLYNRSPKHCLIVNSNGESAEDIKFRMLIEAPHGLVEKTFHLGEIQLLRRSDPEALGKMEVYLQKQEDIHSLGMETERVFSFEDLTMEYAEIMKAYGVMRVQNRYLEAPNAEDIQRFAASA